MTTAGKIIEGKQSGSFGNDDWYYSRVNVIKFINEAREELILELADETYIADDNFNKVITKKEILKKLDELR